jgi:predicted nucleic acid-binding protein
VRLDPELDELVRRAAAQEGSSVCPQLMEKHFDHPMDLADASLIAVAEARDLRTIFSLNEHFRTYQ